MTYSPHSARNRTRGCILGALAAGFTGSMAQGAPAEPSASAGPDEPRVCVAVAQADVTFMTFDFVARGDLLRFGVRKR